MKIRNRSKICLIISGAIILVAALAVIFLYILMLIRYHKRQKARKRAAARARREASAKREHQARDEILRELTRDSHSGR